MDIGKQGDNGRTAELENFFLSGPGYGSGIRRTGVVRILSFSTSVYLSVVIEFQEVKLWEKCFKRVKRL